MALRAINSIGKVLMAASAVLYLKGNINPLYLFIAFGIGAIAYVITEINKKSDSENHSIVHGNSVEAGDDLVSDFINNVLNYCGNKGLNVTLQTRPTGIWLAEVDDESGAVTDLLNLSIPDTETLDESNLREMIDRTCQQIDAKLAELHN